MLISRVSEVEGRAGEGSEQDSNEYQTADELLKLMSKDQTYDIDNESLSTRDLVILYKNIDVGAKLTSNVNLRHKTPNQHVETVVYKDDRESDDSDVSDIYCNEDLQDIFMINNERIDLLNNMSCIQHNLCHKFGDIEMQSGNFTTEYDRQFIFKDPYIKQQLKNINVKAEFKGMDTVLPTSFLDYICCKRLEDNYNFYMDNIIRYVQHTIDQLKRISNGEYLTDRVKEKWREVGEDYKTADATKVLATSVSIPLHVEGKVNGHRTTWDDIVHSEVDIRSLSKILEKKIIIEIPKLICGSYKLFSERHADNLIISCKKELSSNVILDNEEESRVDVVFQLQRSDSGHVISNINSIMILQKLPSITNTESSEIRFQEIDFEKNNINHQEYAKIVELKEPNDKDGHKGANSEEKPPTNCCNIECSNKEPLPHKNGCSSSTIRFLESTQYKIAHNGVSNRKTSIKSIKTESECSLMISDELHCAMRRLHTQVPVLEESEETLQNKKKSPTRVRIKSPYENQSHYVEEKKRKKLLEIREKREKKKMALSENCKITKHKYGKSIVMAQPSSSVTKLSITNKSFYNSIYGESLKHDTVLAKKTRKWRKTQVDIKRNALDNDYRSSSLSALNKSPLDDSSTVTIMQLEQNLDGEQCSSPTSALTNYDTNVDLLSRLIASSDTESSTSDDESSALEKIERDENKSYENATEDYNIDGLGKSQSSCNLVSANTPKDQNQSNKHQDESKDMATPVECRKSIDKIYDLMKKLGKLDESEITSTRYNMNVIDGRRSSTIQISDSGTSVKHHIISSTPSSFSFEKTNNSSRQLNKNKKKREAPAAIVPKVIISTKLQTSKCDADRNKADRKRNVSSPSLKGTNNPLKAISHLLHEFDNVQKTRHKTHRKIDNEEGKTNSRQDSSKKTRPEPPRETNILPVRLLSKERWSRSGQIIDASQHSHHQITYHDDRHMTRVTKKNISDIIDEAKEARGEAVRGPSRPYSRLDTLAQPKKSYVHAHNEEFQNRYGRNITAYRTQRPPIVTPVGDKSTGFTNARYWRKSPVNATFLAKPTSSTVSPIDRISGPRRSASNSPVRKRVPQQTTESPCRQSTIPIPSENLKKKMVAVESYVQNHYGLIDTNQLIAHEVHKSRVPLIPNDIELASMTSSPTAEESTELGKKLHYMIDTMINTNEPPLPVLAECQESMSKLSNDGLKELSTNSLFKIEEPKSESDYPVDVFEDKNIVTAVANIPRDKIREDTVVDGNTGTVDKVTYDVQPFSSATELRKLENALFQKISVGAFPKRLRIKNLTLTPKQSLQQVIVVQSGDAGSLLVKSSVSQSLGTSNSKTESIRGLKSLAALSNTHMNWGYTDIPVQVATIGYAFPTFHSVQNNPNSTSVKASNQYPEDSKINSLRKEESKRAKFHKTSQCFKGLYTEPYSEQSTQANIVESIPAIRSITVDPAVQRDGIEIKSEQLIQGKGDEAKGIVVSSETYENCKGGLTEEVPSSPENVDHSTSLDILMGLLNEIRKLTSEANSDNKVDNEIQQGQQCKDLEMILNDAAAHETTVDNCRELITITSLDKLKRSNSSLNIHSHKVLKDDRIVKKDNVEESVQKNVSVTGDKPKNVDKEVSVDIEKKYVNRLTDVPSCFLSAKINHNPTDAIVEIINEPSTLSKYPVEEYETLCCNPSFDGVLMLPTIETETNVDLFNLSDACVPRHLNYNELETTVISNFDNPRTLEASSVTQEEKFVKGNMSIEGRNVSYCDINYARKMLSNSTCGSEFDPIVKLKRHILVTVYSILVFTVFAALSFPKLVYHFDM